MTKVHEHFWNNWAEPYQNFSELIEPYRDAQHDLAEAAITALGNGTRRRVLNILDVGGGAGNMIVPLLNLLAAKRGNLEGIFYTLTDDSETMLKIARARMEQFKTIYPHIAFKALMGDTLDENFAEELNLEPADLVLSSWNIEYYPDKERKQMVTKLVELANTQGIVVLSSTLRLPPGLTLREVLMPLGRAQVFYALLSGGPTKMRQVIHSLKEITRFGGAIGSQQFPEKPTLAELEQLVKQAGLYSIQVGYHLYGTSAMVIVREDGAKLPHLPKLPIAQSLAGKDGYQGYDQTVSFWGYFNMLRARDQKGK